MDDLSSRSDDPDKRMFFIPNRRPRSSPPDVRDNLRAFVASHDFRDLTAANYREWKNARFSVDTIRRTFGSWGNGLKEVGAAPPKKSIRVMSDHVLLAIFRDIWVYTYKRHEKSPSVIHVKEYAKAHPERSVSVTTLTRRFGPYKKFVEEFARYATGEIDYAALVKNCRPPKKVRQHVPLKVRFEILERDKRCITCGTAAELEIDHIIPVAKGGTSCKSNLCVRCRACNHGKGVR
ncbi:HNH endonuclease [Paracoccus ravus]|uniref:HNH endonuclease n=1 Tax=Paracoccus ravus TaxID=2447760 RepID=UPI001431E0DB|nr:HNH endonuclease [Paracoccus ravus]